MSAMIRQTISRLQDSFRQHKVKVDEAFMAFDQSNSGEISASEFRRGMKLLQIQISDDDVDRLIKHFDDDGDGRISKREFVKEFDYHAPAGNRAGSGGGGGGGLQLSEEAVSALRNKFREHNIKLDQAFLAFDENNDGVISAAEFRRGLDAMQMKLSGRDSR